MTFKNRRQKQELQELNNNSIPGTYNRPLTDFQKRVLGLFGFTQDSRIESRNGREPTLDEKIAEIPTNKKGLTKIPYGQVSKKETTQGQGGMSDRIYPHVKYEPTTQELLESALNGGRRR